MSDSKISALTDGGAVQSTDEFVVARAGNNKKILGSAIGESISNSGDLVVTAEGINSTAVQIISAEDPESLGVSTSLEIVGPPDGGWDTWTAINVVRDEIMRFKVDESGNTDLNTITGLGGVMTISVPTNPDTLETASMAMVAGGSSTLVSVIGADNSASTEVVCGGVGGDGYAQLSATSQAGASRYLRLTGDGVELRGNGLATLRLTSGSADPSAGAGVAANPGSLYLRESGEAWLKTGSGDTAWQQLAFAP